MTAALFRRAGFVPPDTAIGTAHRTVVMKTSMDKGRMVALLLSGILLVAQGAFSQTALQVRTEHEVTSEQRQTMLEYGLTEAQLDDVARLAASAEGCVELSLDKTLRMPAFLAADLSFPPEIREPAEKGYHFFETFGNLYRMYNPRQELKAVAASRGRFGNTNVRFRQVHRGLPVVGAELVFHLREDGGTWFVEGKFVPEIDIPLTPSIAGADADRIAREDFAARRGFPVDISVSPPELSLLNPWVYDRSFDSRNVLIWSVIIEEKATGRTWTYSIDAGDGRIFDVLDSARFIDSEIWDDQNTAATGDDERWYVDNVLQSLPGRTLDPDTTALNNLVTAYYNYLFNTFGIYSIDSSSSPEGMQLVAHAYYNNPTVLGNCPNACWGCINDVAVFCQGEAIRDTVGHELTHGLVQHSGGWLEIRNQSGALNESFADVFGEFFDCAAGNCTWVFGTIRDLRNPLNLGQQPDHMGQTGNPSTDHPLYYPPCNPSGGSNACSAFTNDNGGVHTNSGVPNVVAYLTTYGAGTTAPHYRHHIHGIGLSKAQQLYYSTLVDSGLSRTAEFLDARNVMVKVCENFVSQKRFGFATNDCCQVKNAWASVGIGDGCASLAGQLTGTVSAEKTPYRVTGDLWVSLTQPAAVDANVDLCFLPDTGLSAMGLLTVNGTSGPVGLFRSDGGGGIRVFRQISLTRGGSFAFPAVSSYRSFDSRSSGITLQDAYLDRTGAFRAGMVSSFIHIPEDFTVTDLNVTLNIAHSRDADLSVWIESPSGTMIVLFAGVGGNGINFTGTTLDDEATVAIGTGTAPFTGSFQPQNSLSAFDGQSARGYWRLRVRDDNRGNTGVLQSWALDFGH